MLDAVDKNILKLLQTDAKITIKEISDKTNLSNTPIYERIKRLERDGFIKSYQAIIDREKIGLNLMVYCTISLKQHEAAAITKFEKEIQKIQEVYVCSHIAGMFDYLLLIYTKDMADYQNFVATKLASMDNIGKVQSSFVMSEIKINKNYIF